MYLLETVKMRKCSYLENRSDKINILTKKTIKVR
jgi:hypothetical protein